MDFSDGRYIPEVLKEQPLCFSIDRSRKPTPEEFLERLGSLYQNIEVVEEEEEKKSDPL